VTPEDEVLGVLWDSLAAAIREVQGLCVHDPVSKSAAPMAPFEDWKDQTKVTMLRDVVFRRWRSALGAPLN
jgi:hypothetical protein